MIKTEPVVAGNFEPSPEYNTGESVLRGQASTNKIQTLFYTSGAWYEKDHTGGTDHVEITDGYFVPAFRCRFFTVGPYSGNPSPYGYKMHFDVPFSEHAIDDFIWGTNYYKNIVKIWLDADTTATRINIEG